MSKNIREKSVQSRSKAKSSRKAPAKSSVKATAKSRAKSPGKPAAKSSAPKSRPGANKASPPATPVARKTAASAKSAGKKPVGDVASSVATGAGPLSLSEGQAAPAFDLPQAGGGRVSLSDFAGGKVVLFFYPRANTPGCTREAVDFTRLADDFRACGTTVIGLSADPIKAQDSFRNKHHLTTPLASDEQASALKAYGAWGEKSMYGKTFLGVLRTTVLIDAKGRIARVWRGVKVDGHADEVLAASRAL